MRYKIPVYANSASGCPAVNQHVLYGKGTSAVSPAFSNAADLTNSLDNGVLYATLDDDAVAETYEFFYKAVTSTSSLYQQVTGLKFVICSLSTITPSVEIVLK